MVWVPSTFPLYEGMLYGYFSAIFPVWKPKLQAFTNQCSEMGRWGFLCHRHAYIPLHISGFSFFIAYMPHFCFALPICMLHKILSNCPELSFVSSIPIQQVNSRPASCLPCSEKRRASWPFSSASHPTASEKPIPLSLPPCLLAFRLYLKLYFLAFGFLFPLQVEHIQLHGRKSKKENEGTNMEPVHFVTKIM